MHESFDDGITSRVETTCGDLFNPEIVIHCRDESTHELERIIASELKWDSLDKDQPREKSPGHTLLLAIRKEPKAHFTRHKIYRDQAGSRPWRVRGSRCRTFVSAAGVDLRPPQRTQS